MYLLLKDRRAVLKIKKGCLRSGAGFGGFAPVSDILAGSVPDYEGTILVLQLSPHNDANVAAGAGVCSVGMNTAAGGVLAGGSVDHRGASA